MINLQSIFQKPILGSQFLGLVLISLTLIAIQPVAVHAQWAGPISNTLTTENDVGIGTMPQTNSQRLLVARRDQSQPSEIVIQNLTTTGSQPGAVFRAMADQAHIQFASWTSSRTAARFGIQVGGWNEVIAVGGNGIIYGTYNNSPVIFGTNAIAAMHISTTQNVGIGTNTPSTKLEVLGNVSVIGTGTGAGNITAAGTITGGTINAKYQDVAEWVPASEQIPAGTVVVLDSTKSNHVIASTIGYDTRVAGVISEQPGITLGEAGVSKVLVATTGRVRIKVDATRGPIHIGDLLVTSDIPGLAMKSEPMKVGGRLMHMPGTLIGKALEPLERGSGKILVLLSLQ